MKNQKQKTTRNVIVFLILIVCLVAIIGGTYSRYTSTGTANVTTEIAKWSIKLGEDDISTTPATKNVTLNYVPNNYVKDGTIAPGREATFTIEVDPTNSEVAVDYLLHVDSENITGITNTNSKLAINGAKYKIGNGEEQTATLNSSSDLLITESLADVEDGKKVTIIVTIQWDNDNDSLNGADTENGATGANITIPVTLTARQHI